MQTFGVLLVETDGDVVDGVYEYRGEQLPSVGEEIEVSGTHLPINMTPGTVRARVTEIVEDEAQPIRAAELE